MFRILSRLDPIGTSPLIEAQTPSYLVREINFDWESKLPVMQIAHGSSVLISPPLLVDLQCSMLPCKGWPTPFPYTATSGLGCGTALFTAKASTDLSGISQAMTVIIRMTLLSRVKRKKVGGQQQFCVTADSLSHCQQLGCQWCSKSAQQLQQRQMMLLGHQPCLGPAAPPGQQPRARSWTGSPASSISRTRCRGSKLIDFSLQTSFQRKRP